MERGRADDPVIARARDGDEAAWRELYVRHHRRLVIWLASLPTGDVTEGPEDIASASWMVAASKIQEFDGESDQAFAGWLFAISRNHVVNHRRRTLRRRTDPIEDAGAEEIAVGPGPDHAIAEQAWTRYVLSLLSDKEAEVVACIDVVGLDVATTSKLLGVAPTAVRVRRHRALGRLRKLLADRPDLAQQLFDR